MRIFALKVEVILN